MTITAKSYNPVMPRSDLQAFVETMIPIMLEAGGFAAAQQGRVENIGKELDGLNPADTEYVKQRDRAKTVIDEQVQEKLLTAARAALRGTSVRLDAEEDTPSVKLFTASDAEVTLVIDPIDGTLQYLKGSELYSVCVALVSGGTMLAAIAYFPKWEKLYVLDEDRKPYVCQYKNGERISREELRPPAALTGRTIFANHRVPRQECLAAQFEVIDDKDGSVTWTESFFRCMDGTYQAVLLAGPQVRDLLPGALIQAMPGGYAVDFDGKPISWPDGGRVNGIIFGFGEVPQSILDCLKGV